MEALEIITYILERTPNFFAGRPDEPFSWVARLEPANSGAAPLRSAASTAAICSPDRSGLILWPLQRMGLVLGPRQ
jgi:hypothetical protein